MGKRPPSTSFGLTSPSVLPVAMPAATNPVDVELAQLLRRRRDIMTVQAISALDQPAAATAPAAVPGASSLTEAVSAATAIAGLHQGAAQTAMAEREAAERRAERATAEADKRAEAARVEERSQAALLLQIVQSFAAANQEAMRSSHTTQLELTKQVHEAQVSALSAKVEGLIEQFKTQAAQKDQEIERLRSHLDAARGQETVDQFLARLLMGASKEDDPRLAMISRLLGPGTAGDDPNLTFQRGIAEVEVEKARRALLGEDQRLRQDEEKHQQVLGLIQGFNQLLGSAHQWLPQVLSSFGGGGGGGGGMQNGVPSGFPADTAFAGGNITDVQ